MEVRRMNMKMSAHESDGARMVGQGGKKAPAVAYDNRSASNNNFGGRRVTMVSKSKIRSSYFSLESMVVLVGLTASLLILPLILPPLPPPPFMLLLLPIFILAGLVVFAFMPSSSSSTGRHKGVA